MCILCTNTDVRVQMVASGDDIEAVCHIVSGNLMEGMSTIEDEKPAKESGGG